MATNRLSRFEIDSGRNEPAVTLQFGRLRDGAVTFSDLIGKLDHLEIVCAKCDRHGRYAVRRLIERYGGGMKIPDWKAEITGDCPRRQSPGLADACAAQCPDLLKLSQVI